MDWKNFADHFEPMTCVLSVEKKADGGYGTVRIVTGNEKYIDSLALAAGGVEMDSDKKAEFVPNSEYTRYIPKDLNFEDVCYRCAVLKQPIHNVVRASRYPFDIIVFMMPMESDDENLGYCTFTQVLLPKDDDNLTEQSISQETAREVISTCIKLREDKPFPEIMQEVIEDIRGICGADYCSVLLVDESRRTCSSLGQSKDPGSLLVFEPEELKEDDFYEIVESWQDTMAGSFCLIVRDRNDMAFIREKNPRWYQTLQKAGVERLVLYPLNSHGRFLGYIMAINFDTEATEHIRETLELTSFFIASEIANNQFIDQLKMLNRTDLLTGVLNRNAMNARVSELSEAPCDSPCRMGVVFADMNGLKQVNDLQGHSAGDLMLKNAAMILQSTFVGDEIYRAGGDEFMILLQETDPEDMRQRIAEIKKKSVLFDNVSFAAGCSPLNSRREVRKALAEADADMYGDKQNCYALHPELQRRR
ncbi:MAG: sensor domain-containing diguanylate cyclase [Oscillospiraceae bacterium]|nr:sensor domain-containing diguanylate cyclase [Oscillospiraceae bacterium]